MMIIIGTQMGDPVMNTGRWDAGVCISDQRVVLLWPSGWGMVGDVFNHSGLLRISSNKKNWQKIAGVKKSFVLLGGSSFSLFREEKMEIVVCLLELQRLAYWRTMEGRTTTRVSMNELGRGFIHSFYFKLNCNELDVEFE